MFVHRGFPSNSFSDTALTIGNFDGVHLGHCALFARLKAVAREKGLQSTALTFEPHPREFFSGQTAPARLSTLREKLERIAEEGIEHVVVCHFNRDLAALSAEEFIRRVLVERLRIRHLIVGDDFRFGAACRGDFSLLRKAGGEQGFQVEALRSVTLDGQRVSSSAARTALADGRMEDAARLLGRAYAINGRVVHGTRQGRVLGFATANIRIRDDKLPVFGVFAVEAHGLGGRVYRGVANLGFRPSVNASSTAPLLEVHLFDFSGDIYGRRLKVCLIHKLRDEIRFPDIETLKTQIADDVQSANHFFQSYC
jgi:riboflavin kinase/FMN adenylyltransferase